jgi:hypothetical protein
MKSEKEKMLAGELYDASDHLLTQDRRRARSLIHHCQIVLAAAHYIETRKAKTVADSCEMPGMDGL